MVLHAHLRSIHQLIVAFFVLLSVLLLDENIGTTAPWLDIEIEIVYSPHQICTLLSMLKWVGRLIILTLDAYYLRRF